MTWIQTGRNKAGEMQYEERKPNPTRHRARKRGHGPKCTCARHKAVA